MKHKILWIMVSFLLVAALVLTSCGPADPGEQEEEEEEEEPVGEQEEEEEEEPVGEQEEEEEEPTAGEPQYGGTFTTALPFEAPGPAMMDANFLSLFYLQVIQEKPLIGDAETYGPRGTNEYGFQAVAYIPNRYLKGNLLESWEVSLDEIVWHVRPGIYWAPTEHQSTWMEARELTADDLAQDVIRFLECPWGTRFDGLLSVDGVHATDRYTVVIDLVSYSPIIMYQLGYANRAPISPPELEVAGPGKWENQVGTGPWMFEEYVTGSHMSFTKNPNYWNTTTINGVEYQLPFIDRVVVPIIPDPSTRIAALATGVLDRGAVEPGLWDTLSVSASELNFVPYINKSNMLMFRCDEPPFDDVNVRRAVMIGTNIKAFQDLLGATGMPMVNSPIFPGDPSYIPLEELPAETQLLFSYNPELAIEMLEDIFGPPDANGIFFKTTVTVNAGTAKRLDEVSLLKDQWAKIGVEVEINALESVQFTKVRSPTPLPLYHGAIHEGSPTMNPVSCLEMGFMTGAYNNNGVYSNPELDEAIRMIRPEFDTAKQELLIKKAALMVYADAPQIPLSLRPVRTYWWPWLKNYYGERSLGDDATWICLVTLSWIDQDLKAEMGY